MKKTALAITLSLSMLFAAEENQWTQVLEQKEITAAAVKLKEDSNEGHSYYYAVADKGVFLTNPTGTSQLFSTGETSQPEALKNSTTMHLPNQYSNSPSTLYVGTTNGLYRYNINGEGPHLWSKVKSEEELKVSSIASSEELFVLTEDSRIFVTSADSLIEVVIPDDILPGFDIITPRAIGQEQFAAHSPEDQPWILLECSNGFMRKYILFALPLETANPIPMSKNVNQTSQYFYGTNDEFEYAKATSKGNTVTIDVNNEYLPSEGTRNIIFPEGTIITDITAFDRAFPVYEREIDEATTLFTVTSSIGSYTFNLWKLASSDDDLIITDDIDPTLSVFDSTASTTCIYSGLNGIQNQQFVINERGIAVFTVKRPTAITSAKAVTGRSQFTTRVFTSGIELCFPEKQSGVLSLQNLQGKVVAHHTFTQQETVSLPLEASLAKGVYLIKVTSKVQSLAQKITIK